MISSLSTSSPVSASTFKYLMRCPVLRLIWLKVTFSLSDVAGYSAIGHVTSERRRKPFQFARGAMTKYSPTQLNLSAQSTQTIALFNDQQSAKLISDQHQMSVTVRPKPALA